MQQASVRWSRQRAYNEGMLDLMTPPPVHSARRPEMVLRALIAHARTRGYWPSSAELQAFERRRRRLGGKQTIIVYLRALRDAGLVVLDAGPSGRSPESRWRATQDACVQLGLAMPTLDPDAGTRHARRTGASKRTKQRRRRAARIAAVTALEQAEVVLLD